MPEQAAALLHRLRSALARLQAELELMELDGHPVARAQDAAHTALDALAALEEQALAAAADDRTRVVVLDDDARLAQVTAERLSRRGLEAAWTAEMGGAAELLAEGAVLVADLGLLQAAGPAAQALGAYPLVVVSGAADRQAPDAARRLGAAEFLVKPVDLQALIRAIGAARARARS